MELTDEITERLIVSSGGRSVFSDEHEFEDEVRRIARLLWPEAEFGGADVIDGRERDGIFVTADVVHCIEATISREKKKAEEDGQKLDKLIKKLTPKHPMRLVKAWFITLHEPTPDQRTALSKYMGQGRLVACSYDHFRRQLVDARSYLDARKQYAFGSVRDPSSDSPSFDLKYVPLEILDLGGQPQDTDVIAHQLSLGRRMVLTGDYGAGKSATTRELFFCLAKRFWSGKSTVFPLLLNLRDHHGQTDPVEAIERHGRKVGFQNPSTLVRAWRAGYCMLLLDGFDEIASAGWAGKTKKLRELRFRSMELVRAFVRETPRKSGLLLAGRAHFFDSDSELREALGVRSDFWRLTLGELSLERLQQFLGALGWSGTVPEWLPTRPLLLAYLVSRGFLAEADGTSATPAIGWHELLDRIADREAEIEAGIDRTAVRRIIERVATLARRSVDGLGPVPADSLVDAFKSICGYPPDDRGAVLIQRLPGLGTASQEDGSRVFIDADYAEAACSGDVFAYIEAPFGTPIDCREWQSSIGSLGADIVAHRFNSAGLEDGRLLAALQAACQRQPAHTLAADILLVIMSRGTPSISASVFLKEVLIRSIVLEDFDLDLGSVEGCGSHPDHAARTARRSGRRVRSMPASQRSLSARARSWIT